jgi:hypothetical protein
MRIRYDQQVYDDWVARGVRICLTCKEEKPFSDFNGSVKGFNGYKEHCKKCLYTARSIKRANGHRDPYELRVVDVVCEECNHTYEMKELACERNLLAGRLNVCHGCRYGWVSYNTLVPNSKFIKARSCGRIEVDPELTAVFIHDLWHMQEGKCWYSGVSLNLPTPQRTKDKNNIHHDRGTTASLDRLDSSKGYTPDNVVICSMAMNMAKGEESEKWMHNFIAAIRKAPSD